MQDFHALTAAVFDRQQTDPPLFPGGVAFPHARTNSVSSLVMVIATCARPIPFGEVPVRLIFLIGIPKRAGAEYLELISFLARHVRGEQVVDHLVAADDMSSFLAGFAVGPLASPMDKTEKDQPKRALSPLFRRLLRLKFWLVEHFRLSERQLTLIWAALIGALGAFASEGFRKASEILHTIATGSSSEISSSFAHLPWWQRLLAPTVGGLLAGLTLWFGNRLFASIRQKTTTDNMEAIVVGSGIISVRASIVKSVSALFSISTGTSIGREGPLVQLSSLVASVVGRIRECRSRNAGIRWLWSGGGYRQRLQGADRGIVVCRRDYFGTVVVESLGPLILASVVAAFVSQFLSGSEPLYKSPGFNLHTRWETIPLCCVGIVLGFLAPGYLRFLRLAERLFSKIDIPVPFKLALGGTIVARLQS